MQELLCMPNSIYTNEEYFKFELSRLKEISYFFVCMTDDVKNKNDFKTANIHGKNIIIFNDNGTIKIFENRCVHRFAKLFDTEYGNSKLICKYHGFTYDGNGHLRNKNVHSQIKCHKLEEYKTEVVGKFVFMTFNANLDVKEYLGFYWNLLIDISEKLSVGLSKNHVLHKANWKLLIENVLESYHCPLVHTNTLVKDGYCVGQVINEYQNYNFHSHWKLPKVSNSFDQKKFAKLPFLNKDERINNNFEHFFIFPNLVITSTEDYFFYVGNIHFDNYDETTLEINFYKQKQQSEISLNGREESLERAFFDGCIQAGMEVILEDKPFIESCFNNLLNCDNSITPNFIKEKEFRLIHFLSNYQNNIYQHEK